jgi:hypothetical protein
MVFDTHLTLSKPLNSLPFNSLRLRTLREFDTPSLSMGCVLKATRREPKTKMNRQIMQSNLSTLLGPLPSRRLPEPPSSSDREAGVPLQDAPNSHVPCSLENRDGFWELTINGGSAVLPQNHSLFFVAVLLSETSSEPLSVSALARKVFQAFGSHPDFVYGGLEWLRLHSDESELAAILRLKREALEKLLEREDELEILRAEAQRELESVCQLLEALPFLVRRNAEQSTAYLLKELCRLHATLTTAVNQRGEPNEPVRQFALHLLCHILMPSLLSESPEGLTQFTAIQQNAVPTSW